MSVEDTADETRLLKPAFLRGWRRRCPEGGAGPMMRGYLSVRESCPVCGEEFHHHRADDGPAYLTILIVGHLMAPGLHIYFVNFRPEPLTLASICSVGEPVTFPAPSSRAFGVGGAAPLPLGTLPRFPPLPLCAFGSLVSSLRVRPLHATSRSALLQPARPRM